MILITQIGWALFSLLSGPEEGAWSWPFRNLGSESGFYKKDKDRESNTAHKMGWLAVAVVGVLIAVLCSFAVLQELDIVFVLLFAVLLACEYSLFFDGSFGISIGKDFFYIGDTSKTDQRVGKKGKLKAVILSVVIIALNSVIAKYYG